jgi:sec-independent protein translocase protein TatB
MFDLSWSHILLVLVVALVVVGPKDLPRLMRTLGQWMGKARQMADQFRTSFDEMTRQAELDELRKELEALREHRPFESIEKDLNQSILPPEFTRTTEAPTSSSSDREEHPHPTSS